MLHSGSNSAALQWLASASLQKTPQAPPVLLTPQAQSWTSGAKTASHLRARTCPLSFLVREQLGNFVLDWDFNTLKFSVVDSQPKQLQQLLAVFVDEVGWLLPALILQLRVGAQGQKVAGAERVQVTVLTIQIECLRLAGWAGLGCAPLSGGVNSARMWQILQLLLHVRWHWPLNVSAGK